MGRVYSKETFKKDEVALTIRLSRDMVEEREVLDYLYEMNPKRVPASLLDMLLAGYYHLVKKSHLANREAQVRKKMVEVRQHIVDEEVEESKPKKAKKTKTSIVETETVQDAPVKPVNTEQSDFVPSFLRDGFPQENEEENEEENKNLKKGLSADNMFHDISG